MNSEHFVSSDERSPEAETERFLRGVRHILFPINLAQNSLGTIRYAIGMGQHFGSRLTLLHVYHPPIAFGIPSGTSGNTELWKDRQEAEETLKAQGALVRAAYSNCEWVLRSSDPGSGMWMSRWSLAWISSSFPLITNVGATAIARPQIVCDDRLNRENATPLLRSPP
jgi:hypothetical protein